MMAYNKQKRKPTDKERKRELMRTFLEFVYYISPSNEKKFTWPLLFSIKTQFQEVLE